MICDYIVLIFELLQQLLFKKHKPQTLIYIKPNPKSSIGRNSVTQDVFRGNVVFLSLD